MEEIRTGGFHLELFDQGVHGHPCGPDARTEGDVGDAAVGVDLDAVSTLQGHTSG